MISDFDLCELGAKLRRSRERSGMSGRRVAAAVGFSQSKLSKIEQGKLLPSIADVEQLTDLFVLRRAVAKSLVEDAYYLNVRRGRVLEIPRNAWTQRDFAEAELSSKTFSAMGWNAVPGILQTPEYTTHVLPRLSYSVHDPNNVIVGRLRRQAQMFKSSCEYTVVLTREVLQPNVLPRSLMIEQLHTIRQQIRREKIRIGVLPDETDLVGGLFSEGPIIVDRAHVVIESTTAISPVGDEACLVASLALQEELESKAVWQREAYELIDEEISRQETIDLRQPRHSTI